MRNFVFYRGPSMIDGPPIVAIATQSSNRKTGDMVQTWILRADLDPVTAARNGSDASICGACIHRGEYGADGQRIEGTRTCYVQIYVPLEIFRTFTRGRYDDLTADLPEAARRVAGRMLRLGAYGDPAAVPYGAWQVLLSAVSGHTGYTHQWRGFPEFAGIVMASCDTSSDRVQARALGFRTFRVASAIGWQREAGEVLCPASAEAGKKTTCNACKACGGHAAKARAPSRLCLPATCFKKALRQAALRVPGVAKTEISQLIWTRGDVEFGADWIPVYGVPQLLMRVVRNSDQNHTPDIRTRAILPVWCASYRLIYVSPLLTGKTVVSLTDTSGLICGVGDFRQEKGAGSNGQFSIVDPDNPEFAQIAKATMREQQDEALAEPEFYDYESESLFTWYEAERRRRGREPTPVDVDEDEGEAAA